MKSLFFSLFAVSTLLAIDPSITGSPQMPGFNPSNPYEPKLNIHNEVLIRVNDEIISVMDVIKEMDMIFVSSYPNLVDNPAAKFQFYSASWKNVLDQMINKELMLLDSDGKIEVSEGEVREELEKRFAPNIMSTLDKIGLSLEEAKEKIKKEIIFQRMSWYFINNRAMQTVTPSDIKKAYEDYLVSNPPKTEWTYQVITFRADEDEKAKELANKVHKFLDEKNEALSTIKEQLLDLAEEKGMIKISDEFVNNSYEISENHKQALINLEENEYSSPLVQVNRRDQSQSFRIFYVKKIYKQEPATFHAMTDQLRNDLLQKQAAVESKTYITKIRKQYGMENQTLLVPEDFTPFSMQ